MMILMVMLVGGPGVFQDVSMNLCVLLIAMFS